MPGKHQILEVLTRSRLLEVARPFGVAGRPKEEIVAFRAKSRAIHTERLLDVLKWTELKTACRAAKLGDGGRSKADLVARLLGRDGTAAAA
jgi:hypothetical protein